MIDEGPLNGHEGGKDIGAPGLAPDEKGHNDQQLNADHGPS